MVHPIHIFSSYLSLASGVSGVNQTMLSPVQELVCAVGCPAERWEAETVPQQARGDVVLVQIGTAWGISWGAF